MCVVCCWNVCSNIWWWTCTSLSKKFSKRWYVLFFFLLWSYHYFFRTWPRRTTVKLECSFKNSTRFCSGACILAPWLLSEDSSSWHKIQQYSPWRKFGAPCIWFWSSKTFGRWGCPCHDCSGWHFWLFGTRCVFFSSSFLKHLCIVYLESTFLLIWAMSDLWLVVHDTFL